MQESLNTVRLSNKYLHSLILAGIIILTIIIYSDSLKNEFTNFDDDNIITNNKNIQDLSISGIVKMFSSYYVNTYLPLTILIWSLIYHFFSFNPIGYHSVNLLFHVLNIMIVYLFIYKLTSSHIFNYRIQVSALVACLFAIHPMNTESISWINALYIALFSFCYLASLIFYLKYLEQSTVSGQQSTENNQILKISINKYYLFSILLFLLSLLSKSIAVTLPIILFLLDYYRDRKFNLKVIIDKIPFFLLAFIFGIIAILSENFTNITITNYSLLNRLFIFTYSISFYIIYLIAPIKLSAMHPTPDIANGFLPFKYYLSPLLIIFIFILIIKTKKTRKEIIFGTLFFLISISITLIVGGSVRYVQVAERYTYIPYLGLFYILAIFISQHLKGKIQKLKALIIVIFILCFSFITYNRNKVWSNSISLFDDVLKKYPKTFMAYNNRGSAKHKLGDFQGALEDYNRAIEINPLDQRFYYNRGGTKAKLGDLQGAIMDFNSAIEINTKYLDAFINRGNAKGMLGNKQGAIQDFTKAIEIDSQNAYAFYNRGSAKYILGNKEGACKDWNKASELGKKEASEFIKKCCH
jgi:protein O-mannosyl-transferase